ncbi:MAG: hypothetical protein MRZ46_06445 [Oscillospiraceae bacterium]|nr:hypothetical protein [Oscillospiraceae bacterium]
MNKTLYLWMRRIASVISLIYCGFICRIAYFSFYYDITIDNRLACGVVVSCVSLLASVIMLFSRKQIFTKLAAVITIPALLPVVLIYYGNWELIIPVAICAVAVFFLVDMKETTKIGLGTIFLLLYVIGSLAFFIMSTLFSTTVQKTVVSSGVSESGKYRYEIVNTKDSSNGSTSVFVEPNDADYDYKIMKFAVTGYERNIFIERPVASSLDIAWKTESRTQMTTELLDISSEIVLNLDSKEKALIGYAKDDKVKLSELTDEDFNKLGISESGDVLYINGEPCFRYYIAELEGYFNKSQRKSFLFQ